MIKINILLDGEYSKIVKKLRDAFKKNVEIVQFIHTSEKVFIGLNYLVTLCKSNCVKNIGVYAGRRTNLNMERLIESGLTEIRYFD